MKVYEIVAEQIIEQLEKGNIPWRKPWNGGCDIPRNALTGKAYRGVNLFTLDNPAYETNYWLTANQAKQLGGKIAKGEKYSIIVFWKWLQKENDEGENEVFPMLRFYKGWNLDQTEGLEEHKAKLKSKDLQDRLDFHPIEQAESIVEGYKGKPDIRHKGNRACYSPLFDIVEMPNKEQFHSVEEYYSTLFHELGHSTGHKTRLDRKSLNDANMFGDHNYSKEELVAELTASFLCRVSGIDNTIENSGAYIRGWLSKLKSDKKHFVYACQQAQKAADLIQGIKHEVEA